MLNQEIPKEIVANLKVLVLDSDGVCVERGTKICETEEGNYCKLVFESNKISDRLSEKINVLSKKMQIVISSGRSLIYLQSMYSKVRDKILMAENGNLIMFPDGTIKSVSYPTYYFEKLALIKNDIKKLSISGFEPKQHILTVHCPEELQEVYAIVDKHDQEKMLKVMWNKEAFDIQDKLASKGAALENLIVNYLGFHKDNVIAIGDRLNDKEMVEWAKVGVSADINCLPAEYFIENSNLAGEILVDYLLLNLK